ncbi:MAG: glycine cleavage system protein GcvH [Eubacteriales bacterium]|nr:glycine cleavage system protein GcvH [Eubacteriales bacterium]
MSNIPNDLLYAKSHEWIKLDGDTFLIGITDHAQCELGDLVFAEVAAVGKVLKAGQVIGSIESVKTASDIYSPVDGEVIESNSTLGDKPEQINEDPYASWFIRIRPAQPGIPTNLLDAAGYKAMIGE